VASSRSSIAVGTVYWEEEPDRRRKVLSCCRVCFGGRRVGLDQVMCVSPQGVAHESDDYGVTVCGKDGTGTDWWWRV
jgi:hypothetical protein